MSTGMIFDINEFSVHDGHGIRTTVFLKGCPLKCQWCHNPEGINFNQELIIGNNGCIKCGRCNAICKHPDLCVACGECTIICPINLRRFAGKSITSDELVKGLLKNKDFLIENGGVTFSGGEPLAQPKFLFEASYGIKPVNIAIETSGYAPRNVFLQMLELFDLIMMDIKHTESKVHKMYTGIGNEVILENLKLLIASRNNFIIRIPVIPGVNDNVENMDKTARLLCNAEGLERIELLQYHKTAGAKYELLGKTYDYKYIPDSPSVESFRDIFESKGLEVFIP
jgi:pyruvate formate lyase activating enzyme